MVEAEHNGKADTNLRRLYPNRSDEELAEAEINLGAYLEVVVRILAANRFYWDSSFIKSRDRMARTRLKLAEFS